MSDNVWIRPYKLSWLEWLAVKVIQQGRVPRHIAVIMDGNRRFARQSGDEVISGHKAGFEKLAETLQWCREVGVREVTVYAFSIENFNRAEQEVSDLLNLAREKFIKLLDESEKLKEVKDKNKNTFKHLSTDIIQAGVKVRILGNLSYLPQDLREVIEQVEEATADNTASLLNIALSYTAREEITHAVKKVAEMINRGDISEHDVSVDTIDEHLYTRDSPPPDLMIRTSGETRLSDFMLWQASKR